MLDAGSLLSLGWKVARAACPQASTLARELQIPQIAFILLTPTHRAYHFGYLVLWVHFQPCPCHSDPAAAFACLYFHQTALQDSCHPALSKQNVGRSLPWGPSVQNLRQTLSVLCCEGSLFSPSGSPSPLPLYLKGPSLQVPVCLLSGSFSHLYLPLQP